MAELDLEDPWHRPGDEARKALVGEAHREIKIGHELANALPVECLAACGHCDDTAFRCADGSFAVVHLTWNPREIPPWPGTVRARNIADLKAVLAAHDF
jgi:hypothetical protein